MKTLTRCRSSKRRTTPINSFHTLKQSSRNNNLSTSCYQTRSKKSTHRSYRASCWQGKESTSETLTWVSCSTQKAFWRLSTSFLIWILANLRIFSSLPFSKITLLRVATFLLTWATLLEVWLSNSLRKRAGNNQKLRKIVRGWVIHSKFRFPRLFRTFSCCTRKTKTSRNSTT